MLHKLEKILKWFPTMKPLASEKKKLSTPTPIVHTATDFSNIVVEPLFKDMVDFDTFKKFDYRVVKVLACEAVPKSSKLLKFTLDDGESTRTILSGIHEYYTPEELVGKTCVAITNLPTKKMMGIDSKGMLISAVCHDKEGKEVLHLLMLDDNVPAGAKLY